jgi:hypothetical protein
MGGFPVIHTVNYDEETAYKVVIGNFRNDTPIF